MDTSNPSLAIQQHLATMPSFSSSSSTATALISDRIGVENMDGQGILSAQPKSYARPWLGCIPIEQLSKRQPATILRPSARRPSGPPRLLGRHRSGAQSLGSSSARSGRGTLTCKGEGFVEER
ncbi:MAG: hypothetical protein ALECFALPRED_007605 [Alectoria fallacina]|uniref:Uncharacterized protein n=1 Tax=Alectoria fallacina TaxID=1903189 RepID=A0A8H3G897_9LECA|nr:MAG: hypothetical protein ALECFALPRED_007605 [Alectoria fallacina]